MTSLLCHATCISLSSNQIQDLDELEVYGSESQSGHSATIASYKFEVCDSVINIGPIKDMALGMPAFLSVGLSVCIEGRERERRAEYIYMYMRILQHVKSASEHVHAYMHRQ